ncbi:MAG: oligosaccharide flippase family protein [Deltaproteobacteria bacterium]|nr:oligosaccharide flippase family protein [Deltaproteobacteria bacterium]
MIAKAKSLVQKILPKNTFARGVSILVGGTASAQILLVLAAPLLTRLYSPEDFGLLAVYASLLALIGVVSCLRYELAIPLPENDQEAANVAALCLILVAISSLLTVLLVVLLGEAIAVTLSVPKLANYFWLLPVGVLVSGAYSVFSYWGIRTKRFTTIAATKLRQAIAMLAIQLAAYKLGGIALLFGQVAGQGVGTTSLALPALTSPNFRHISWQGILLAKRRYRRFPLFLTWDGLLNTTGTQLPPILFAALFGPVASGLYSLAHRVISLPASLLGDAIGQVFFGNAAETYRAGQHGPLVSQLQAKLIHIGMPLVLILILLGPDLFALVFGEQWRQAGEFSRWMAPWLFFGFVFSPLSTLFAVMERQKQFLMLQAILFITRLVAIGIGAYIGNLSVMIMLFSGVSAICYFGFLFWVAHLAGNRAQSIYQPLLVSLGLALVAIVPLMIAIIVPYISPLAWAVALLSTAVLLVAYYWKLLRKAY